MMRIQSVLLCCIAIVMLSSCQQEQGNYTSVYQENAYIFGVWKAPSVKIAKGAIANISVNIRSESPPDISKDKKTQEQIDTEKKKGENQPNHDLGYPFETLPIKTTAIPETLLPEDGETTDWIRSRQPSMYNPQNIYLDRYVPLEIYPEMYHKYGFQRQAETEYQSRKFGSIPLILLEIFDMGTPENAYGIYSLNSYPLPQYEWVGCKAIISGKNLWFWKGKYFIQMEGYEIAPGIREGMVELAKVVAKKIQDRPQKIQMLETLPQYIEGSDRLFTANWVLENVNKSLPNVLPLMGEGSVGVLARTKYGLKNSRNSYIVFVLRYPTNADATSAYLAYQDALTSENVTFEKVSQNGAILIDETIVEQP